MATGSDPEQGQRCFIRARAWLWSLATAPGSTGGLTPDDPCALLQILPGIWLCEQALATVTPPDSLDLTELVADFLHRTAATAACDRCAGDTALPPRWRRVPTGHGRVADGFTDIARDLAGACVDGHARPFPLADTSVLLARLGLQPLPAPVTLTSADTGRDGISLLRADGRVVRSICDAIAGATRFGLIPLRSDREVHESLATVLPIILVTSLRHNDLETGAAVLRTLRYLRLPRTHLVRQAITFLFDQQQADGRFGFFAAESVAIAARRGWLPFDAAHELHLPATIACLWALAELTVPGFALAPHSPTATPGADHGDRRSFGRVSALCRQPRPEVDNASPTMRR